MQVSCQFGVGAVYEAKMTAPDQSLRDYSISVGLPGLAIRKRRVPAECAVYRMPEAIYEVGLVVGTVLEAVTIGHDAAWGGAALRIERLLLRECPDPLHHKHRCPLSQHQPKDGTNLAYQVGMDACEPFIVP